MRVKYLCNPFYIYILVFSLSLYLFSLHLSGLYPALDSNLLVFFSLTFAIAFIFGYALDKAIKKPDLMLSHRHHRHDYIYIFIVISIIIEFIHNKGIPIVQISNASIEYDYQSFGIKSFHVLIFTLASFYTLFLFEQLFYNKSIAGYLKLISLYLYPILILSRGAFLMTSTGMIFIYLMSKEKISIIRTIVIMMLTLGLLYLFGVLGGIRQNDESYMMKLSMPTASFIESNIPKKFMWSYMYASSPVANLQLNVNSASELQLDKFVLSSIIPDFISKRLTDKKVEIKKVANWLIVGTVYSRSFVSMGWIGMWITFFLMCLSIFTYLIFLRRRNKYYVSGYTVLLIIVVYSIFANMWVFSGLSLQLVYPFILDKYDKMVFK